MTVTQKSLSRRTFLHGMGAAIALPLLDSMVPAFAATRNSVANPIKRFGAIVEAAHQAGVSVRKTGNGLNPLLQNYWIAIHPPCLYFGYIGFAIPFCFAIAALITYFPVLINGIVGFRDVDPGALHFLQSVHASPREVFLRLRWPSALPYLFAALKIAATLSLIGAVVAEFFAAGQGGLGAVIDEENRLVRLDRLFAAIVTLAMIGVLMNLALALAERRLLSWHRSTWTASS